MKLLKLLNKTTFFAELQDVVTMLTDTTEQHKTKIVELGRDRNRIAKIIKGLNEKNDKLMEIVDKQASEIHQAAIDNAKIEGALDKVQDQNQDLRRRLEKLEEKLYNITHRENHPERNITLTGKSPTSRLSDGRTFDFPEDSDGAA